MKIKAGRPLIEMIKLAYTANQSLLVVSRHGIGKSEIMAQAAHELGIGYISRDLSLMDISDLAGMPRIEEDHVRFIAPSFLPREGKGIICFEELNRAKMVINCCLTLISQRILQDYALPKPWLPVACINPSEDGYNVEELDKALESRFVKVEVEPDITEWLKWAEVNEVHEHVRKFVAATPRIFDAPLSNPRAWTYVSTILQASSDKVAEDILLAAIAGIVGDELALAFVRYSETNERPLDAEEIIHEYTKHRPTILRWRKTSALDLLNASLHNMKVHLQCVSNYNAIATPFERTNIKRFVKDLTGDLRRDAEQFFREHKYREILGDG